VTVTERDAAGSARATLVAEQRDLARERILRAARGALAERGLATTVDEVAEAAGVSRRTVFRHFDTRENLFAQALRESLRSYGDRVGPSVGATVAVITAIPRNNAVRAPSPAPLHARRDTSPRKH